MSYLLPCLYWATASVVIGWYGYRQLHVEYVPQQELHCYKPEKLRFSYARIEASEYLLLTTERHQKLKYLLNGSKAKSYGYVPPPGNSGLNYFLERKIKDVFTKGTLEICVHTAENQLVSAGNVLTQEEILRYDLERQHARNTAATLGFLCLVSSLLLMGMSLYGVFTRTNPFRQR